MPKQVPNDEVLYHIGLSKDMIEGAEYVLLPGDPYRVEGLAKSIDPNAKHLNNNREYISYLCDFHGQKVLVCSTGMGCPSVGIGVEELATIGLKYFIRVGTSGGIQSYTNLADVIISKAAVRLEGTSSHYAPMEYPAVASFELTNAFKKGAEKAQVPHHVGITASSDTFWPGQERHDNYSGYLLRRFQGSMAEWKALNVLNFEMEASGLFVICSAFGLEAAAVCAIIAKREDSEEVDMDAKRRARENWEKVVKEGLYVHMQERGLVS
ncbi:MAG: uridine phosphorylase [Gammaproteobacteria bacterium]|nr:uridine phosphorylase [Gammaproteobacteria bacterium]